MYDHRLLGPLGPKGPQGPRVPKAQESQRPKGPLGSRVAKAQGSPRPRGRRAPMGPKGPPRDSMGKHQGTPRPQLIWIWMKSQSTILKHQKHYKKYTLINECPKCWKDKIDVRTLTNHNLLLAILLDFSSWFVFELKDC